MCNKVGAKVRSVESVLFHASVKLGVCVGTRDFPAKSYFKRFIRRYTTSVSRKSGIISVINKKSNQNNRCRGCADKEVVICADKPVTLQCQNDTTVNITSANYGSLDSHASCGVPSSTSDSYCVIDVLRYDVDLCGNDQTFGSCVIDANNSFLEEVLAITERCNEVYKLMEVTYQCIEGKLSW